MLHRSVVVRLSTLLALAALGRPAIAEEAPLAADTAVRVAGSVTVLGPVTLAAELSRSLGDPFGVDISVGYADLGFDHHGVGGEVLGRVRLGGDRHRLDFGVGPSVMGAREFGVVAALQGELAYEYRRPHMPSVLIGLGPRIGLNDSGTAACPESGWFGCFLWKDHYKAGDFGVRLRLAIGAAF